MTLYRLALIHRHGQSEGEASQEGSRSEKFIKKRYAWPNKCLHARFDAINITTFDKQGKFLLQSTPFACENREALHLHAK